MTTGRLAVIAATIVALFLIAVGAVVGLTETGRPTGVVMELTLLIAAPTVTGLLAIVGVAKLRFDLANGLGTDIAERAAVRTASRVGDQAAAVARELAEKPSP